MLQNASLCVFIKCNLFKDGVMGLKEEWKTYRSRSHPVPTTMRI